MKKGWETWGRLTIGWAGLLFSCSSALPAQDPCLTLSLACWTNGQIQLTLAGESSVIYVIEASPDLQNWTPVATNDDASTTRLLTLDATDSGGFFRAFRAQLTAAAGAIIALNNVNLLGGTNITIDSFNSAIGPYDMLTNRNANGDVASLNGIINVQNAHIYGHIRTGPNGSYTIGTDGIVGDLNWAGPGVEPGWYENSSQPSIPDVTPPYDPSGCPPPTVIVTSSNTLWVLGSSKYAIGDLTLNSGDQMKVLGNATLYVTGSITMKASGNNTSSIMIEPGASLRLFVGGANATFQQVNTSDLAPTFQYFGLPGNSNLTWQGNSTFTGCIYAPEAAFVMGGGGNYTYVFQGACVVNSFTLNGHFAFHYDENLRSSGSTR